MLDLMVERKILKPEPGDYQNIFPFKEANDSDKISSNSKDSYPCFASELEKGNKSMDL